MRQLLILLAEFFLILAIIAGIYYVNLFRKFPAQLTYHEPIASIRLDLSDENLKQELIYFLSKELQLYGGNFQILDVTYLYTSQASGADYILVSFKAPDGRICQITVARNILPWAKWEVNPEKFTIIEPIMTISESRLDVPQWMLDLGATEEQLRQYYLTHPDNAQKGAGSLCKEKEGKCELPSDWYQSVFVIETQKDKLMRLLPDTKEKARQDAIDRYWKADYPEEYIGPGYREYLYQKIKDRN